jgi:hypothetical protein
MGQPLNAFLPNLGRKVSGVCQMFFSPRLFYAFVPTSRWKNIRWLFNTCLVFFPNESKKNIRRKNKFGFFCSLDVGKHVREPFLN